MKDRQKFIIGIILLLTAVVVGIWQFSEYQGKVILADSLEADIANLTSISSQLTDQYQEVKSSVAVARETAEQEVSIVFPTDEGLTDLTRLFDDFAVKNNFSTNPFFISQLQYQSSQDVDDEDYRYVPLTMNVESSSKNLNKFFEFIESSGSLESETRLLSIEDMTITYPAEYGGTYNVRLTLYAYFSREI